MGSGGLHHRLAAEGDRSALASFPCKSLDPDIEAWIRNEALDHFLDTTATNDLRLLVCHQDDGRLVAVGAHERNWVALDEKGEFLDGTYWKALAIADPFRDTNTPDGEPLISSVVAVVMNDIRSRQRGDWVSMLVKPTNTDGRRLVERLGATHVGRLGPEDAFVLYIGPPQDA